MDGLETPPPPKCTSLVYLYSDMWRSFDVGLYIYIHRDQVRNYDPYFIWHSFRYVYSPFRNSSYKGKAGDFLCGILCFVFVAIFHGKV